jgi:hypothetical protein
MALQPDQKFSTFAAGGNPTTGDIIVGLRGGINTKFTWNGTSSGVNSATGTQFQVLVNNSFGTPVSGDIVLTLPQDIAPSSSPTFNNLQLDGGTIFDVNGNVQLSLSSAPSAVNYIQITNDAAGGSSIAAPTIKVLGTDTSIDVVLQTKGPVGGIAFVTECTEAFGILNIYSGTSGQHQTNFDFPNTAAVRGVAFQDASGTVAFLSDIPGAFTWNNVTGTTAAMSVSNGYKANNAALVTLTLPTSSVFGNVIQIAGFGAGGWSIAQAAGQSVIIGAISSTVGVAGSVSSSNQFDSVVLVCMEDNLTWQCIGSPQGNLTII